MRHVCRGDATRASFRWPCGRRYKGYDSALRPLVVKYLPRELPLLQLGMGTSTVHWDMVQDGYRSILSGECRAQVACARGPPLVAALLRPLPLWYLCSGALCGAQWTTHPWQWRRSGPRTPTCRSCGSRWAAAMTRTQELAPWAPCFNASHTAMPRHVRSHAQVADVRNMQCLVQDGAMAGVLDKGTLDALLCASRIEGGLCTTARVPRAATTVVVRVVAAQAGRMMLATRPGCCPRCAACWSPAACTSTSRTPLRARASGAPQRARKPPLGCTAHVPVDTHALPASLHACNTASDTWPPQLTPGRPSRSGRWGSAAPRTGRTPSRSCCLTAPCPCPARRLCRRQRRCFRTGYTAAANGSRCAACGTSSRGAPS